MALANTIENLPDVRDLLTHPKDAVEEMRRRRKDPELAKAVSAFLNDDIPTHFQTEDIFFYLARHLATPNFETLRAKEIADEHNVNLIVGEDLDDKFVSVNYLKKALAKMTFETGRSKTGEVIIEKKTIVDFRKNDGKKLLDVTVDGNNSLHEIHQQLLESYDIDTYNESDWVARNKEEDMAKFYEKFLALSVTHGIMLEFYAVEDVDFVKTVFRPAFVAVEDALGHRPLICTILEPEEEFERDWLAYPKEVKEDVETLLSKGL